LRLGKRLSNLPALRQVGFTANRCLLGVQRISHNPADGITALAAVSDPITTPSGTRIAGMRITDPRVQSLLAAICAVQLLPGGFTSRDLRTHLAPLLGRHLAGITSGQITYDLRRLRIHGLIERLPRTHRYQITPAGIRTALFLTRLNQRFLIPGTAQITGSSPPAHSTLRAAARAYEAAIDDLARDAGLAA